MAPSFEIALRENINKKVNDAMCFLLHINYTFTFQEGENIIAALISIAKS